jgi:hypothetical protein
MEFCGSTNACSATPFPYKLNVQFVQEKEKFLYAFFAVSL